jgi:hypothetical protein
MKVSAYLIDFAINTAREINDRAPICYIALMHGHDKLISFYGSWGFNNLDKTGWMFIPRGDAGDLLTNRNRKSTRHQRQYEVILSLASFTLLPYPLLP